MAIRPAEHTAYYRDGEKRNRGGENSLLDVGGGPEFGEDETNQRKNFLAVISGYSLRKPNGGGKVQMKESCCC